MSMSTSMSTSLSFLSASGSVWYVDGFMFSASSIHTCTLQSICTRTRTRTATTNRRHEKTTGIELPSFGHYMNVQDDAEYIGGDDDDDNDDDDDDDEKELHRKDEEGDGEIIGNNQEEPSVLNDLNWRVEKLRLEEANTRRFLKSGPRFLPYEECRKWVKAWNRWENEQEWKEWIDEGEKRNSYIPARPDEYYGKRGEWKNWEHFLGVEGESEAEAESGGDSDDDDDDSSSGSGSGSDEKVDEN